MLFKFVSLKNELKRCELINKKSKIELFIFSSFYYDTKKKTVFELFNFQTEPNTLRTRECVRAAIRGQHHRRDRTGGRS